MKYYIVGNKDKTEFLGGHDYTVRFPIEAMHSETTELIKTDADRIKEAIIKYLRAYDKPIFDSYEMCSFYKNTMLPLLENYVIYEMEIILKEIE
jgi:hypothetical protein